MDELGYRPNLTARALATGRSNTLGVVSFDTTLHGPASTLFGIERAAHEAGYFIIVASMKALDRASLTDAVERLRIQGVDGILVIAPLGSAAKRCGTCRTTCRWWRSRPAPGMTFPWSRSTSTRVRSRATGHLLDLGHKTVWQIAGPAGVPEGRAAIEAWRQTLEAAAASSRRMS